MMLDLRKPDFPYDAVLPANSMWIRMGDRKFHRIKEEASIMRSPVVFGVKKSIAESLGWTKGDVKVEDILKAVKSGRIKFAMTSATQSNSGASAYMGMLNALAGQPDVMTSSHLSAPDLHEKIKTLLSGVDRSSGSSGWLKDMFIQKYDYLDAMFNYESMVISLNQALVKSGREPLYVIYPSDGLAIADSTLGFAAKNNNRNKLDLFIKLRDYLLTPDIQKEISKVGFRAGLIGMNPENVDKSVYNPDWGIDLARTISPITWPKSEVIEEALSLYQTVFRKPSYTVYLLDISGSMAGPGLEQLKQAMMGLLDQNLAGRYMLQASADDIIAIIPFHSYPLVPLIIKGQDPNGLKRAIKEVNSLEAGGGTNIYQAVAAALDLMAGEGDLLRNRLPAVILMTDGKSNKGSLSDVRQIWSGLKADFDFPPVFGVTFGDADDAQLRGLAKMSAARVFDGRKQGLQAAFRQAKGYN